MKYLFLFIFLFLSLSAHGAGPWINVKASPWNAICNGSVDDTPAIQNAINANPNSRFLLTNCKIGNLSLPSQTGWTTLIIHRRLTLTSTLIVPSYVSIEGLGGSLMQAPFTHAPTALITCPQNMPCIKVIGLGNKKISNITFLNFSNEGDGIWLKDTANVWLENIGIMNWVSGKVPLKIENSFGITANFIAITQNDANTPSILFTTTTGNPNQHATGLVDVDHLKVIGSGMWFKGESPGTLAIGNFSFKHVLHQSNINSTFNFDGTYAEVGGFNIKHISTSDSIGATSLIKVTGFVARVNCEDLNIPGGLVIVDGTLTLINSEGCER